MDENTIDDNLSAYDDFGEAFDQSEDPLKKYDKKFKQLKEDPIEIYKLTEIDKQNIDESRKERKKGTLDKWKSHMCDYNRHPACPSTQHASDFIMKLLSEDTVKKYLKEKLSIVANMFEYWMSHPKMPHGTGNSSDYNPIKAAITLKKNEIAAKPNSRKKSEHRIPVEELRQVLQNVKNILHLSVITTQFKYASRSGQIYNLRLPEVKIDHAELNNLYPELGTHPRIKDVPEDVIYFVSTHERPGGKSERPIMMPIDSEMRSILIRYLRQRPPTDDPWVFINNSSGKKLRTEYINNAMWKPVFHPEYAETDDFEAVTSHYGRHRFSTYWRKEIGMKREYIKYMRGDKESQNKLDPQNSDSLDEYVHTYYEDIRDPYLSNIYKFNLF